MSQYPQHERLLAHSGERQAIVDFLGWLQDRDGFSLCEWRDNPPTYYDPGYWTTTGERGMARLIAEFFEVNLDAFEAEKTAMITASQGEQ